MISSTQALRLKTILKSLRPEQWEYYINECLPRDRTVLDKLVTSDKPMSRWRELVRGFRLADFPVRDKRVDGLISSSRDEQTPSITIRNKASLLREQIQN